jgi:uncharacterized protein
VTGPEPLERVPQLDMFTSNTESTSDRTPSFPGEGYRTSSYVIYVDLQNNREQWLIVHGYTGAYDLVGPEVVAFLRSRETQKVSKPLYGSWDEEPFLEAASAPSASAAAVLTERGYLTRLSHPEEVKHFEAYASAIHERSRLANRSYVIMPTYDCNLRCHYCFQDQFRTDPSYRHLLRTMSFEMWDRIAAGLEYIEEQFHGLQPGLQRKRAFTFFGGEPLLTSSKPLIEYIIRSQRRPDVSAEFSAVTNATELDAFSDLLSPDALSVIQVTLDGPEESHDTRRIYADGSGSFRRILRNVQLALDNGVRVSIRVNVDRHNATSLPALADTLAAEGWQSYSNFSAYLAPIFDYTGLKNAGGRDDFFNHWELSELLMRLHAEHPATRIFSEVDGTIKAKARSIFANGDCERQRAAYCGAHTGMYIFDPFGDIYACWDRTGDQRLRIGSVDEQSVVRINKVGEMWRSRSVVSNNTCKQCRYALHCGGGCAALAEVTSGTIFSNFCDAYGKRFRAAIAQAYESHALANSAAAVSGVSAAASK